MAETIFRSPAWKPLKDLRNKVTFDKHNPRPYFGWSSDGAAEAREDAPPYVYQGYPALMFKMEKGVVFDVTVQSLTERERLRREGWLDEYPAVTPLSLTAQLQTELEALSPEDRTLVLEAQRQQRIKALTDRLAGLTPESLASVAGADEPKRALPKAR